MRLNELDTPALIVDLDVLCSNVKRMADYARQHGLRLRPHIKTHKVIEIARMQMEAGAVGLTVAKLSEAEVMIAAGFKDILIANSIVGPLKCKKLVALQAQAQLTVAIDSYESANSISQAWQELGTRNLPPVRVLLDIDVGFHRTGFSNPTLMVEAAQLILKLPGIQIDGLFCFPGHGQVEPELQPAFLSQVQNTLSEAKFALEALGVKVTTVSSGSTPTALFTQYSPVVNEFRPGTYVFNDSNYLSIRAHTLQDCALKVHALVTSQAVAGQIIIDAGSKTMSSEPAHGGAALYGQVVGLPDARFFKCSEEHGWIDISQCKNPPRIGDRLQIIPNHVCPTVNLHDRIYYRRGDEILGFWNIAARGKVQ